MLRLKKFAKINFSSWIITFILMMGFISVCYQVAAKNIGYDILGIKAKWFLNTICTGDDFDAPETVKDSSDEKKDYPFKTAAYEQVTISSSTASTNVSTSYGSGNTGVIGKVYEMMEKYTADYFMFTDLCEYVSKQTNNFLGNRLVTDSDGALQIFLSNGHMTYERPYKSMDGEISNITNFATWLKSNGTDFFYVAIPATMSPEMEESVQAEGYRYYANDMADELTQGLADNGIDYIDLREYMESENKSYTDYFFKYEHHMVPEAGLWAAGKVSGHIDEVEGTSSDRSIFSLDSYTVTSAVKSNGLMNDRFFVYEGKENIDFLHPNFRTDIRKYIYPYDLELSGTFDDVFYASWEYPSYNTWNHGIKSIKTYRNENVDDSESELKILLLTESYSDVISPFLACAYAQIDEIDLRCFKASLQSYIEETKPDLVICMSSAYELGDYSQLYNFK